MKDNMIKSGLTAVSAIGFLLLGSCSSQKPNDAIFNSRQGHMPAPAVSGSSLAVTKPVVQPDSGQPILLNDNTSPGSGIIIDDSAPVIQPGPISSPPASISKMSYQVKKNESLWSIARAHGVSRHDLARENGLSPDARLKLNQNLSLPAGARYIPPANRPPIKPRTSTSGNQKYKVKKGDSLSVIAYRYKTSVSALKSANNLKSNTIRVNQTLTIPNKNSPRGGSVSRTKSSVKASGNLYTVKKGDTISEIAQKNGTTTKAIMQANGLKNHNIFIGKKLVIPGYKGSGGSSKPKKPSNLQEEIKNDLFGDKKAKTPEVKVEVDTKEGEIDNPFADKPDKVDDVEVKTQPKKTMKTMDVLVVESDTLETLAKDFMTTVPLIKDANPGVSGNEDLKPGMVLKVPRGN